MVVVVVVEVLVVLVVELVDVVLVVVVFVALNVVKSGLQVESKPVVVASEISSLSA